jgi:hypothetical protein
MSCLCPKAKIITRTSQEPLSDRLSIVLPDGDEYLEPVAYIESIIAQIDERVMVRLLAFHTEDGVYCAEYKDDNAEKRFCCDNSATRYVHFHCSIDRNPVDYLLAFLPRSKNKEDLRTVVVELYMTAKWLNISQEINCIIFRYGRPIHESENKYHWQEILDNYLEEMKRTRKTPIIEAQIKHIQEKSGTDKQHKRLYINVNNIDVQRND